jgi:hypothetical protein
MSGVGHALQKTYDVLVKGETPQAPVVAPPPPPPDPTKDPAVNKAQDDAALNERKAKGRASTMLTGASGLTTASTTAGRTLLGS